MPRGRPPKPKPLPQKVEREMMGDEDIQSTERELTDAQKRMAKAREAKAQKALASKENITLKIEEPKPKPKAKPKTLESRIQALPIELRRYTKEFIPTPVSIKNARRFIQLLQKGRDILHSLSVLRGIFWTQDGYYTTAGFKNSDKIIDDTEEIYGDFSNTLEEALVWFKNTYDNKDPYSPNELMKKDKRYFEPNMFGLEKNENYGNDDIDDDWEFNGEYLLGDYGDMEDGNDASINILKEIIGYLKEGGFKGSVEVEEIDNDDDDEDEEIYGSGGGSSKITTEPTEEKKTAKKETILDEIELEFEKREKDIKVREAKLKKDIKNTDPKETGALDYFRKERRAIEYEKNKLAENRSSHSNFKMGQRAEANRKANEEALALAKALAPAPAPKTKAKRKNTASVAPAPKAPEVKTLSRSRSIDLNSVSSGESESADEDIDGSGIRGQNRTEEKKAIKAKYPNVSKESWSKISSNKYKIADLTEEEQKIRREYENTIKKLNPNRKEVLRSSQQTQRDQKKALDFLIEAVDEGEEIELPFELQGEGIKRRLKENQMIGEGIRRMIEGGATPDQRNIAGFLRSRITADVAPYLKNYDPKIARDYNRRKDNTWFALQGLLHSLVHSVDSDVVIKKGIKDYGLEDFLPAYTDYEDRENYTDPSIPEMFRAGLSNKTLPDEVIKMALEAYVKYLDKEGRIFFNRDGEKRYITGEQFPKALANSKYFSTDMIEADKTKRIKRKGKDINIEKFFSEKEKEVEEADLEKDKQKNDLVAEATWTNITGYSQRIKPKLGLIKSSWSKGDRKVYESNKNALTKDIAEINSDIEDWVDKVEKTIKNATMKKNIYDEVSRKSPYSINPITNLIDYNIPQWDDEDRVLRIYKGQDFELDPHPLGIPDHIQLPPDKKAKINPPAQAQAKAQAQAPAPKAKAPAPKAKAPAPKGRVVERVEGKGMKIDFEDMNWGSLTEQMKAYNSQHKKNYDLESFARMIVANPSNFQQRTLRRARFYINVLLPKKK